MDGHCSKFDAFCDHLQNPPDNKALLYMVHGNNIHFKDAAEIGISFLAYNDYSFVLRDDAQNEERRFAIF